MRESAREALAVLWHEADEQMMHSQYRHFPSWAEEGVEVMVLPARDHDRMRCFIDQVKLTRALVWDLDESVKEVKLLEEHEESSQKITELETLCKKLMEDIQRSEEEKATLEGMVESRDELLMEIARETGLDRLREDAEHEEEDEDVDNGGDATAPFATAPLPPVPPVAMPEEVDDEGPVEMIPQREAPVPHEAILAGAELEMSQLRLYHVLMRDYEENPLRMEDDFDDLDDDPNEGHSDVDEWFSEDGSNDRDWVIKSEVLSLGLRISF
jgi:hypothetical protein